MLSLNIPAFLFHTILEFCDARYRLIRQTLSRRTTFFDDIRALTRYLSFDNWMAMLLFMLKGLKLEVPGDIPSNSPSWATCLQLSCIWLM